LQLADEKQKIDWNYSVHGKLWNYNLQYLDYIQQEDINLDIRLGWIEEIYSALYSGNLKPEPYPASLRAMNVIRFFSSNPTLIAQCPELQSALYAELNYLHIHYEYHLLGNHLLENCFSMLMGGYYFQNPDVGFTILLTDIFQFRPKNFKFLLSQIKMPWIWNTAINPWENSLTMID
jgi:hypothetical protein